MSGDDPAMTLLVSSDPAGYSRPDLGPLYDVGFRGAAAGPAMNIARWATQDSGTLRHSAALQGFTASPRNIAR